MGEWQTIREEEVTAAPPAQAGRWQVKIQRWHDPRLANVKTRMPHRVVYRHQSDPPGHLVVDGYDPEEREDLGPRQASQALLQLIGTLGGHRFAGEWVIDATTVPEGFVGRSTAWEQGPEGQARLDAFAAELKEGGNEYVRRRRAEAEAAKREPNPRETWIREALEHHEPGSLTRWLQRSASSPPFGLRPWTPPQKGAIPPELLERIEDGLKRYAEKRGGWTEAARRRYRQVVLARTLGRISRRRANPGGGDDAGELLAELAGSWDGVRIHRLMHAIDAELARFPVAYVIVTRREAVIAAGDDLDDARKALAELEAEQPTLRGRRRFLLRQPGPMGLLLAA